MTNGDQIYLTAQGLEKLKLELMTLKTKLREIAERIDKAKELGDLSENAEYHEAKEDYAFTAGKIMEIEDTLNRATVMAEQTQKEVVQMGSTVRVQNGAGKEKEYTLVGPNEADPLAGRISYESPLAQSFLGHKRGERVEVTTPGGSTNYTIVGIK